MRTLRQGIWFKSVKIKLLILFLNWSRCLLPPGDDNVAISQFWQHTRISRLDRDANSGPQRELLRANPLHQRIDPSVWKTRRAYIAVGSLQQQSSSSNNCFHHTSSGECGNFGECTCSSSINCQCPGFNNTSADNATHDSQDTRRNLYWPDIPHIIHIQW